MDFLLEHGSDNVQVVVTSRSRSGLPLSRIAVRDELTEIEVAAMRFGQTEANSFLVDVAGLDLQDDDVIGLRDSTDGWVAGLQWASLSLRGSDTPAEVISHISGRHHAIADFLTENVLNGLDPDMSRVLMMTSITERICGSLACALSDQSRGQACPRRWRRMTSSYAGSTKTAIGSAMTACSPSFCGDASTGTTRN